MKYNDKAKVVEEENKELEARLSVLDEKMKNYNTYKEGIESSKLLVEEIIEKYGPGNTPEKSIMFVDGLEKIANMSLTSVSFSYLSALYSVRFIELVFPFMPFYTTPLLLSYVPYYHGLKSSMDFLLVYFHRMNFFNFTSFYHLF